MLGLIKAIEEALDKWLNRIIFTPLNEWLDRVGAQLQEKYPPKFDFRYDKVEREFLTIPANELDTWDADYLSRLEEKGMKP